VTRAALAAYRALPARPPSCAGSVYPEDPAELRRALGAWLALEPHLAPAFARPPRIVVAPHVDYPRGAASYARAARALATCEADLFVLFGTAHASPRRLFTLTRHDYVTPLGTAATDRDLLAALVGACGEEELLADELCHRDEHAVELPLVVLQHVARRPFTLLPVLCSSISHLARPADATRPFLDALARATAGRKVAFVAGADLAHVGPLYGDPRPPTSSELVALEREDRRTLAFVEAGDAEGFHRSASRDDLRRRICGTAPLYAALRASRAGARVLHYAQWTDGVDSVSFAAAAG
jgi:AmmeMemoRadiSam system protein B